MGFQFQPYTSPLTSSIAQTLQQAGAIEAQRAYTAGNAAANAALQSGNAWSGAIQGVGHAIGALPEQIQSAQRAQTVDQLSKIKLADAQRQQQAEQAQAELLQNDAPLPPGVEGPQRPTMTDENGLLDVPKAMAAYAARGFGDHVADFGKAAELQNDAIKNYRATQTQLDTQKKIVAGTAAHGVLTLMQGGIPIDQAFDQASHLAVTDGVFSPADVATLKDRIVALPPEQQQAALETLRNNAARLGPKKTVGKDQIEHDMFDRVTASNIIPEKPTEAMIALDLSSPDPVKRAAAEKAMAALKPAPPPRPIEEQLLEAIAKGDTTKASQITQTLKTAAEARRDPAAASMARELGGLRADEARARLDALQKKNEPVDITPDVQTTTAGRSYVDLSTYTGDARNRARDAANAAGAVPVSKEQAGALQQIDNARANQRDINNQIKDLLPTTPGGRGAAAVAVPLQKLFQSNDQIGAFNSWRTAAIQTLRATAGSQGLRINEAEIAQAVANDIPQLTDTVGTAQQKLKNIDTMLENAERSILVRDRSTATPAVGAPTSSGVVAPPALTPGLQRLSERK